MATTTVTQDEIDAAVVELSNLVSADWGDDSFVVSVEKMAYQGFDPKYLLALLIKKGRSKNRDAMKDLRTLALLGTMRGGKISTIGGKATKELSSFLDTAKNVYSLYEGKPRNNTDATLLRIAAIFAGPIIRNIGLGTIDFTPAISPDSVALGFPKVMCVPSFGSVIPPADMNMDAADLLALQGAFTYHQYMFDRLINSKTGNYSSLTQIKQYVLIQVSSPVVPVNERIGILNSLGLIERKSNTYYLSSRYSGAIKEAYNRFTALA